MDEANFKGTDWRSICSEELNYTYLKSSLSFDELPIAVSELLNLAVHRPLKVPEGGGGGGCTAIYGLYGYVPLRRVWFSSSLL